jgi:D-glucosaminate-6-phosphate ammonia-lyase
MPTPVVEAMNEAADWFVDIHELNEKAGEIIANITGAEAGLITAGSAAGMLLQAAACMTGSDPAKIWKLPDTSDMKNEIVIHRGHQVGYTHSYRAAGAHLVEIGSVNATAEWELETAINSNTAAVAYVYGPRQSGALCLAEVVKIAHSKEVPVIVDASAMLPPPENLHKFIDEGADLVSFSGGKGLLGPQSTGILCGKSELIQAAYANSAPNSSGVARAAKVCKEEIAGLITALKLFVETDHRLVADDWKNKSLYLVDTLGLIEGLKIELIEADYEARDSRLNFASVKITFSSKWAGKSRDEIVRYLEDGDPSIRLGVSTYEQSISLIPVCLQPGEEQILGERLRDLLVP